MSYQHRGDAWTDVETPHTAHTPSKRMVYCDRCADAVRREIRERFEDDMDAGGLRAMMGLCGLSRHHVAVGHYYPEADDRCDGCGVVAREQL